MERCKNGTATEGGKQENRMVIRKKRKMEKEMEVLRKVRCEEGKMKQGRDVQKEEIGERERTCETEDVEVKEGWGVCVWSLGMCDGT